MTIPRVGAVLILLYGVAWCDTAALAQSSGCRFLLDCEEGKQSPPPPSSEVYDPVNVVKAFYLALSRADGPGAVAFVAPEKRGTGGFIETNITSFYSTIRDMRILSIERASNDFVSVRYRFTRPNGSVCLADARVNTIYTNGKTYIQGISANC
jgi:hypothetical protein